MDYSSRMAPGFGAHTSPEGINDAFEPWVAEVQHKDRLWVVSSKGLRGIPVVEERIVVQMQKPALVEG